VDPLQTDYFSENLVAPGIEHRTSGSIVRNSDQYTTETVHQEKEKSISVDKEVGTAQSV
jgi:hypothetical protein